MRYSVLGPLEVRDGERIVDLGSRKQRAVLALLLIHADRVVSVDTLLDGLWGESPPATAHGTLQAYISNLRKVLEPGRARGAPPAVLLSRAPGYAIHVGENELDAVRFQRLAARGGELLAEGRADEAREILEDALALWKGPAYSDFVFEPFAQDEIVRLEDLRLNVLEDKVEAELALGHHRMLIGELRRLVEREPLRERLRAHLAVALYRDERQADALATLREGRERLAEELGIDPGPHLRRLEDQMLRQDPALDWRPPPSGSAAGESAGGIVGRRAELEVLSRAAQSAHSGRGRVLLVAGDPGMGKTTLLEQFVAWDHGLDVRWGRCYEGEGAPPLWPWRQILDRLVADTSAAAVLEAAGELAGELVDLLPDLSAHVEDAPRGPAVGPEEARFRLYLAVTSLLTRLSVRRPLMLVLDDVHWADSTSLRLLEFVAKEVRQARVLIVATYRDVEVGPGHPLAATLASLARLPVVERIMLHGLSEAEVGSFVRSFTRSAPAEEVVKNLHARTDGNPFFLTELLRLVKGEGAHGSHAIEMMSGVPANVRDVILKRVGTLPREAQRLLEIAAVIGRVFEVRAVAEVEGSESIDVLDSFTPALASRLLVATGETSDDLRFSHALVRDAIYEELTPGIRARLHLRCGEVLEQLHGTEAARAAQIAAHFLLAGVVGGAAKAIHYAQTAADHAMRQLAYEDAEQQYRAALRLLQKMPAGSERDSAELRLRHGLTSVLMTTHGYTSPEIAGSLERIRELSDKVGDERQRASALWASFAFHATLPEMDVATELSDELLRIAADSNDPSVKCIAHTARGRCCWQTGALEESRRHFQLALTLVDSVDRAFIAPMLPEQDAETYCKTVLAEVLWLQGKTDEARTLTEEALRGARRLGHPLPYVIALGTPSILAAYEGKVREVRTWIEEMIDICRANGYSFYVTAGSALLGWAVAHDDDPSAGLEQMKTALEALERSGTLLITGMMQPLLAMTQLAAGRSEDALASVERGLTIAGETGHRSLLAELHRLRAEALQVVDPAREVEISAAFREAVRIAREHGAKALEHRASSSLREWESRKPVAR